MHAYLSIFLVFGEAATKENERFHFFGPQGLFSRWRGANVNNVTEIVP